MLKVTDEQLITAILTHASNKKAAESLGISLRTYYTRTSSLVFKEKLARARERMMDNAATLLAGRMTEAAATMLLIMRDQEAAPQVRLNASDTIMRNAQKLSEHADILRRLDELENKLEDEK